MVKNISETAFATQVEDLFELFQWRWTHFRPAWSTRGYRTPIRGGDPDGYKGKGFPDYVAVRGGLLIIAELKDEKTKLTEGQEAWIKELKAVEKHSLGVMVFVWRPSDLEKIVGILK